MYFSRYCKGLQCNNAYSIMYVYLILSIKVHSDWIQIHLLFAIYNIISYSRFKHFSLYKIICIYLWITYELEIWLPNRGANSYRQTDEIFLWRCKHLNSELLIIHTTTVAMTEKEYWWVLCIYVLCSDNMYLQPLTSSSIWAC